jgi:HEPN domain-containing protein/predicted nucleotidyltransferase
MVRVTSDIVHRDGRHGGPGLAEWVPEVVEDIVRTANPLKVILFGSLARGEHDGESDIDLLVVLDHAPPERRKDLMATLRRAVRAHVPVDIFVTDAAEIARRGHLKGWFLYPALEEGVVVHEQRDTPADMAGRWLNLARGDLASATVLLGHQDSALRNVGFLAQQAAEKALKAVLAARDADIPRTHDLTDLLHTLADPPQGLDLDNLARLSKCAVGGRYPGDDDNLTRQAAEALVATAEQVLSAAETLVAQADE